MDVSNKKERSTIRLVLKMARQRKGLKQVDVAKYLGMEETSYQRIELGLRGTREENWIKLYYLFNEEIALHDLMENGNKNYVAQQRQLKGNQNKPE